jgi:hypothetical protein
MLLSRFLPREACKRKHPEKCFTRKTNNKIEIEESLHLPLDLDSFVLERRIKIIWG